MSDSLFSYEAQNDYEAYTAQAEREHDFWVPNQWTPYENLTIDDLMREFATCDDPRVTELLKRIWQTEYTRHAFMMLHGEMYERLDDLEKDLATTTNEDGLTMGDLDDLVGEHRATIHRLTTELEAMTKKFNRAQARSELWKKKLKDAKQALKYETRSVDRLEARTRRKINV